MIWQVVTVDLNSQVDCLKKFQSNSHAGALLFGALVIGGWVIGTWLIGTWLIGTWKSVVILLLVRPAREHAGRRHRRR